MENSEKKLPVKNLKRIAVKSFKTFGPADDARAMSKKTSGELSSVKKIKVFKRRDGSFDVVWYVSLTDAPVEVVEKQIHVDLVQTDKKRVLHGLRAKDRRAQLK